MKFFIELQLITYEVIHFLAGTSSFKDSLLFLPHGRYRKNRRREVEAGIPSEVIHVWPHTSDTWDFNGNT